MSEEIRPESTRSMSTYYSAGEGPRTSNIDQAANRTFSTIGSSEQSSVHSWSKISNWMETNMPEWMLDLLDRLANVCYTVFPMSVNDESLDVELDRYANNMQSYMDLNNSVKLWEADEQAFPPSLEQGRYHKDEFYLRNSADEVKAKAFIESWKSIEKKHEEIKTLLEDIKYAEDFKENKMRLYNALKSYHRKMDALDKNYIGIFNTHYLNRKLEGQNPQGFASMMRPK